jgi:DNA adenine methylase
VKYLGGKAHIAKELAAFIAARHADRWLFLEPFMGGGNMTAALAPHFSFGFASDVVPDLALLYEALQAGWVPPEALSAEEYATLRYAPPSAMRAFAGFGCSFGGKWFGGYARATRPSDDYAGASDAPLRRNYAGEESRSGRRADAATRNVEFRTASYDTWPVIPGAVVYCDPPYAATTGYSCGGFDHGKFWNVMRGWRAGGAHVYVSEYAAPDDWRCVWERARKQGLRETDGSQAVKVERLFM